LCARILPEKGKFVSRTSVFPLTDEELRSEVVHARQKEFELSLKEALGKHYVLAKDSLTDPDEETPDQVDYEPIQPDDPQS
jgi:hypothetical protein